MNNYLVVTGASQGIGKSTAELFISHRWHVINIARSACDLPGVINFQRNLADPTWVKNNADILSVIHDADRICLVHNAAVCYADSVPTLTAEQLRIALELNVVAPVSLNQLFLPLMLPGSSVIYIGSTLAEKAVKGVASYVTSKHAIAGLMKATCQDLIKTGIHSCCVCPGITDTAMLRARIEQNPALLEVLQGKQLFDRLVQPREIADVIWFCANHPVMNGAVVHGNLGQVES